MKIKYTLTLQYEDLDRECKCLFSVDPSTNKGVSDLYSFLIECCSGRSEISYCSLYAYPVPEDDDSTSLLLQDPVLTEYDWRESISADDLPFPDIEDLAAAEDIFGGKEDCTI